ncbi:ATP-dependent helicase, partial [Patescibacteria group bacterium]|nr:ATP-dependent helicase [Patescibacteria group bacterium]
KTKVTHTAAEILKEILEVTNYIDKFKRDTEENIAKKENVDELLNVAAQFDNVSQFLENIALIQDNQFADKGDPNENSHYVNLMSLHSAKGLEFEVVLMVGMEDGLLPHSRSLMDNEQMEEERRLCYVGITRAKSCLYLTYSRSRFQYGANISAMRSRFIEDIPQQLLSLELEPKRYNNYSRNSKNAKNDYKPNYDGGFKKKPAKPTRRIVIDDDLLDGVLAGDFDIDKLIES